MPARENVFSSHLLASPHFISSFRQFLPAAVQQFLIEPPPDALPGTAWIDGKCIEDHAKAGKAAERRLILCAAEEHGRADLCRVSWPDPPPYPRSSITSAVVMVVHVPELLH